MLVMPAFAFASEIIPVFFSRKPIFGYPIMVGATSGDWLRQHERLGSPYSAYDRHELRREYFFCPLDHVVTGSDRNRIFNWLATMCGAGRLSFKTLMLFCIAFLFQFLIAGLTGIIVECRVRFSIGTMLGNSYFVVAHSSPCDCRRNSRS